MAGPVSRTRRGTLLCARGLLVLILLLGSAIAEPAAAAETRSATARSAAAARRAAEAAPSGPVRRAAALARALRRGGTQRVALRVTADALWRSGVRVEGRPRPRVASPIRVDRWTLLHVALDSAGPRALSRLTLGQLGAFLRDVGGPVPRRGALGRRLQRFLRAWVAGARARPKDPESFAALLFAARARTQGVDVARPRAYRARDLALSSLDVLVLLAQLSRGAPAAPHAASTAQDGPNKPCTDAREWLNERIFGLGTPLGAWLELIGASAAGKALAEWLKYVAKADDVKAAYKKYRAAIEVFSRLHLIYQFFTRSQITVTADKARVHRPLPGATETVTFTARAGIDAKARKDYDDWIETWRYRERDEGILDCLKRFGVPLPVPTTVTLSDLVAQWSVEWRVDDPLKLVNWGLTYQDVRPPVPLNPVESWKHLGQQQMTLTPDGQGAGTAELKVQVLGEDRKAHRSGCLETGVVEVTARIDATRMPSLAVLLRLLGPVGNLPRQLVRSLTELVAGWAEAMFKPTAQPAPLTVEWHVPSGGARAAAAGLAQVCVERPPRAYTAIFSGTTVGSDSHGGSHFSTKTTTWSGRARFELMFAAGSDADYRVVGGNVDWRVTLTGDCSADVDGSFPIEGVDTGSATDQSFGHVGFLGVDDTYTAGADHSLHDKPVETQVTCQSASGPIVETRTFGGPESWLQAAGRGRVGETLSGSLHVTDARRDTWTLTPQFSESGLATPTPDLARAWPDLRRSA